jgi:ALG6, ALG8 glycosyltransferase family
MTDLLYAMTAAAAMTAVKVMLMQTYHSTDMEVHRNWMAITKHVDYGKWCALNDDQATATGALSCIDILGQPRVPLLHYNQGLCSSHSAHVALEFLNTEQRSGHVCIGQCAGVWRTR